LNSISENSKNTPDKRAVLTGALVQKVTND
jgi:hypothetical protein